VNLNEEAEQSQLPTKTTSTNLRQQVCVDKTQNSTKSVIKLIINHFLMEISIRKSKNSVFTLRSF